MSRDDHESHTLLTFIVGAAAGAAAALLLAPRSGTETRDKLKTAVDDAANRASHIPEALGRAVQAAKTAFAQTLEETKPEVDPKNGARG